MSEEVETEYNIKTEADENDIGQFFIRYTNSDVNQNRPIVYKSNLVR